MVSRCVVSRGTVGAPLGAALGAALGAPLLGATLLGVTPFGVADPAAFVFGMPVVSRALFEPL